jgi:hypothetical protein
MKNKLLRLLLCCIGTLGGSFLFNYRNFDVFDFLLSLIFGVIIWILLIIERKI